MAESAAAATPADGKDTATPVVTNSEDMATLRRQLDESREREKAEASARRAAEARTEEANRRIVQTETRALTVEETAVANALQAEESAAQRLEEEIAAAGQAGEFGKIGKLTRELAATQTRIERLTENKATVAERKANPVIPVVSTTDDPRLAQYAKWPRTQAWIREHPQYLDDKKFNRETRFAHEEALESGHAIDTDGYLRFIEDRLTERGFLDKSGDGAATTRSRAAEDPGAVNADSPISVAGRPPGSSPYAAAAPSRSVGGNSARNGGSTVERLSAEQAEIADLSFPEIKDRGERHKKYADLLRDARREGRMLLG